VQLPKNDLRAVLGEGEDFIISDYDDNISISVDDDPFDMNEALLDFNTIGIEEDELCALLDATGCYSISSEEFRTIVTDGNWKVYNLSNIKWTMADDEMAAAFLATEVYIPFTTEVNKGDLVLIEDILMGFMDWASIWDEYSSMGYSYTRVYTNIHKNVLYIAYIETKTK